MKTKFEFARNYRNFATKNEMAQACDTEIVDFIRPKRRAANLPNSWDDKPVAKQYVESKKQMIRSKSNFRDTIRHAA